MCYDISEHYFAIYVPGVCTEVVDLVFILDDSGSIADDSLIGVDNWAAMLQFVADVVAGFIIGRENTRVGLITFDNIARNHFYLQTYERKEDLVATILSTPYVGKSSNTAAGIRLSISDQFISSRGDRPGIPNMVVVVTDGQSNDPTDTHQASLEAKKAGIKLFSIGVGSSVDSIELR